MTISHTLSKKEAIEILNVDSKTLDLLVKEGKLTRKRKNPDNPRSTWVYSSAEIEDFLYPKKASKKRPFWKFW